MSTYTRIFYKYIKKNKMNAYVFTLEIDFINWNWPTLGMSEWNY